jgi:hypothetical protein
MKKTIYILIGIIFITWVGYRGYRIGVESNRVVFNAARDIGEFRVQSVEFRDKRALRFTNGRADVPCATAKKINVGVKLSDGSVVQRVTKSPSVETGLCAIFAPSDGVVFSNQ